MPDKKETMFKAKEKHQIIDSPIIKGISHSINGTKEQKTIQSPALS
nr:MAG TPA: hypothetical protein [Caudoviricetes sp.]